MADPFYDPKKSPLRGSFAADHAADTQRLIAEGQRAAPLPVADPHAERVAQAAQAESAARRARMAAASPGNAAAASTAESVAASPLRGAAAVAERAKTAGSAVVDKVKGLPGAAARTVGKLGAMATVATAAGQTVSGAGGNDYDARFGIRGGSAFNNPVLRAAGIPETVLNKPAEFYPNLSRLPINAAGAVTDLASNAANAVGQATTFGAAPQIGFADQARMRAQQPAAPAASPLRGGAGGAGSETTANPNTFVTGDGRTAFLPAGITVAKTKNGNNAFGGGQTAESQALLQAGVATNAPAAESPLRRPDLNNIGSGFAPVSSRSSEINRYYDNLSKQIQDLHGGARFQARGSLANKLLELEKARAAALGQNQGAIVDSQRNVVSDVGNRIAAETNLYGTDVGERSSLRRDNALKRSAEIQAQSDALKARQAMSEDQLKLLDDRATAAATDADGKVDPKKKQQIIDAATVNFGGAFDGTAPTLGQSAAEGADAATMGEVVAAMNRGVGAGQESNTLPALSRLREPTWGEAFDSRSNITVGDNLRRLVDGLPGVADSRVIDDESGDPRTLRLRDTTRNQREALRRRGQMKLREEDIEE